MKNLNNILAIITAITYNLFLKKDFEFYFLNYNNLSDLWYCLIYFHLVVFSYQYYGKSELENIVFITFFSRFLYNAGILFKFIEYNSKESSYFVIYCIIGYLIYEKFLKKWLFFRLKL